MNWRDVMSEMLEPKEPLASVIDTFLVLGEVLEFRLKLAKKEYIEIKELDDVLLGTMFKLSFFPFWNVHGNAIRPLFIQAIQSGSTTFIEDFFSEAIPCALTIAMPHRQAEYAEIRTAVKEKFTK